MSKIWRYTLLAMALVLMSLTSARAQYDLSGSDPARLKWNIIKGEHFDVIYPQEVDSLARRYLYNFEKTRDLDLEGLKINTPKMPIVLHPYNVNSNGVSVWAPRRLELQTTPPFAPNSSQHWDYQLALHEGRHIGQMTIYTKGFFRALHYIAGEQSIAIGIGFYPSQFSLEGDAVLNETDFSLEGRGRRADFLKYYRAAFHANERRTYQQWRLGSFIRYTPNSYAFGYLMMSTMRLNSGNYYSTGDLMNAQRKYFWRIISNSHKAYQEASGLTARKNWRVADSLYSAVWAQEYEEHKPFTPFESLIAKRKKPYLEIINPLPTSEGIVAGASGMESAFHLIRFNENGKDRIEKAFSSNTSGYVLYDDNTILFAEVVPDPVWEHESYSILRTYDVRHDKFRNITRRTRFFNPAIGSAKNVIYAVEYPVEGNSNVVKVDYATGNVLETIKGPQSCQIVNVAELYGDIYASIITLDGQGIFRYNSGSGCWETVARPQPKAIVDFKSDGDSTLYFVSDLDGVDNVYALTPKDTVLMRLTSARFSAKSPYIDTASRQLYYSDYDSKGYIPVRTSLDSLKWEPYRFENYARNKIADALSYQAAAHIPDVDPKADSLFLDSVMKQPSERYRKFPHLLRVHSWAPFYASVDKIMNFNYEHFYDLAAAGATVISQNTLGTAWATAGYSYHNGFHAGHAYFKYLGWHPKIEFSVDFNDRHKTITKVIYKDHHQDELIVEETTVNRPSLVMKAALTVPIDLSRSGWNSKITPVLQYSFSNDEYSILYHSFAYRQTILAGFNFYRVRPTPKAKIYPRWGIGGNMDVRIAMGQSYDNGMMAYANVYGYFPGIARNQGLKVTACYQKQYSQFSIGYIPNIAKLPRGYKEDMILTDYYKFTFDYAIPLYFVDGHTTFLYYMRRIKVIPFLDYAYDRTYKNFLSGGCDLMLDFNLFRISYKLSLGVRYARTLTGQNYWHFLTGFGL